jgi:hypothetical protein
LKDKAPVLENPTKFQNQQFFFIFVGKSRIFKKMEFFSTYDEECRYSVTKNDFA